MDRVLKENIRKGLLVGFLIGNLHGFIDISIRVAKWSFEWFELYQTLLISVVFFTLAFAVFGLSLGMLERVRGKRYSDEQVAGVYLALSASIFLLFYSGVIVNRFFLKNLTFFSPIKLLSNALIMAVVFAAFVSLCMKGRRTAIWLLGKSRTPKVRGIFSNLALLLVVFIITSLAMDYYLLRHITHKEGLDTNSSLPNIIIINWDSATNDHLPLYGYWRNTAPNLDKLANRSVVFEDAYVTAPLSISSKSSLFTGLYPYHHGAVMRQQNLGEEETTLAEILGDRGYNTALFTGGVYTKKKYGMAQGFFTVKDRLDFFEYIHTFDKFSLREALTFMFPFYDWIVEQDGESNAEEVNRHVLGWLKKNSGSPFFMFIDYADPHAPYTIGQEFRENVTGDKATLSYKEITKILNQARGDSVPQDLITEMQKRYDTEIFFVDRQFGNLLNSLEDLAILDNTVIMVFSDNGEEFYDHGDFGHARALYQESIKVPLVIYYPAGLNHARISQTVSIADLFPTTLAIVNITTEEDVDGANLLPVMRGEQQRSKDYVLSELYGRENIDETLEQRAIIAGNWKLITVYPETETLKNSLFDLKEDPSEKNNLYGVNIAKRNELLSVLDGLR